MSMVQLRVLALALCAAACSSDKSRDPAPADPPSAPVDPVAKPPPADSDAAAAPTDPTPVPEPADAAATAVAPTPPAEPDPVPPTEPDPAPPAEPDPAPPARPDPAKPAKPDPNQGPPRNLRVLPKRWSRDQVVDYMKKEVSPALGVDCDFCHDKRDFAADTKHKQEAREMITLTKNINAEFFGGKSRVNCMTCHNGAEEPAQ